MTLYTLERILYEQLKEIELNPDTYTPQNHSSVCSAITECVTEIEATEAEDWWFWQQITDWNL